MKLINLHINGFGKFHDLSISLDEGLNVIYGRNEAGKSTLHAFLQAMFFGLERQRGRAAKNDLFSKYKPWNTNVGYGGWIRVEYANQIYRIERDFFSPKDFQLVNETLGRKIDPPKATMDQILCGLSETSYRNTISIGQLKSATEGGMVAELRNYIANMNTSGNMALNITRATTFLKNQRKELERQMVPEAARTYTSLLGEIRTIEKEISAPEFENHLTEYEKKRAKVKEELSASQSEKEGLIQKVSKGRQVLESNHFKDEASIQTYKDYVDDVYEEFEIARDICEKPTRKILSVFLFILGLISGGFGVFLFLTPSPDLTKALSSPYIAPAVLLLLALVLMISGIALLIKTRGYKKDFEYNTQVLEAIFSHHLGDSTISDTAMRAFAQRMEEFKRLGRALSSSELSIQSLNQKMDELHAQQTGFGEEIEKQQKLQWELEKKLEQLANRKNQAEGLKDTLAENDRISNELAAIDLALETITTLSSSIRDSFGLYLNKEASELISGITGGIYNSISVDENLNIFMNTEEKLVPIDQVSSGTMDQIYLALRMATARLIQSGPEPMPLIFDDSFVLYDDGRLKTVLKWLKAAYSGQIIIFSCHRRESAMLTENNIGFHLIRL